MKCVFERLVAITLYLARQNIAFAGKQNNSGNFYELVQMVSQFDMVLKTHLENGGRIKYLTPETQNELICIIGNKIRRSILNQVMRSKYYSIILDCTSDTSRKEQLTLVLRYVFFHEAKRIYEIKEDFIEFINITDTTGLGIADVTVEELKKFGLIIDDIRGQGFDNGSSMKGKNKGVQKRIKDLNPLATYIPCINHSLNLSLNDTASASGEIYGFFTAVQQIFNFLSGSTHRWNILLKHCSSFKDLTPKPLSTTRWSSRYNAVKPLRRNMIKILVALQEIIEDESFDAKVRHEAEATVNQVDFKFICSVCIWYDVLEQFERVSKSLQKIESNISSAVILLRDINDFLNDYKRNGYAKAIEEAVEIAGENDISASFVNHGRGRRFNGDLEEIYKVNFFEFMISTAQESITERFTAFSDHSKIYSFLYEFERLEERYGNGMLLKSCKELENHLKNGEKYDIDGNELCSELRILGPILKYNQIKHIIDILNLISLHHMENAVPNTVIAYRILLTIPVSIASGERSFSKLKLIKSYLRSTMGQDRLSNLAIISIEKDLAKELDYDDVIDDFVNLKARKSRF